MKVAQWLVDGVNHKGSHFLICVFTENRGHRSTRARIARGQAPKGRVQKKRKDERRSGGGDWQLDDPRSSDGERSQWRHKSATAWTAPRSSGGEWPPPQRSRVGSAGWWDEHNAWAERDAEGVTWSSSWERNDGVKEHCSVTWWHSKW